VQIASAVTPVTDQNGKTSSVVAEIIFNLTAPSGLTMANTILKPVASDFTLMFVDNNGQEFSNQQQVTVTTKPNQDILYGTTSQVAVDATLNGLQFPNDGQYKMIIRSYTPRYVNGTIGSNLITTPFQTNLINLVRPSTTSLNISQNALASIASALAKVIQGIQALLGH